MRFLKQVTYLNFLNDTDPPFSLCPVCWFFFFNDLIFFKYCLIFFLNRFISGLVMYILGFSFKESVLRFIYTFWFFSFFVAVFKDS